MKLGINTVLFKAFDVKTALKAIRLAGYDGAELSAIQGMCEHLVLDAWETQVPLVKAAAKGAGVELLSMEVASLDEDRLEKAFKAAQYLGIPVVNVGPGGKMDDEGRAEAEAPSKGSGHGSGEQLDQRVLEADPDAAV